MAAPTAAPDILLYLEAYYRNAIPRGKLMRQVTTGMYLTDRELWERWQDQNETVEIRYIPLDLQTRIDDTEIELAMCQLCTLLSEVEMIATDLPAKWSFRMNSYFQEVKGFIASQCIDEARHTEVFRKRALANGVGLLRASIRGEHSLKGLLDVIAGSDPAADRK